ncbi:TPA: tail fiber assembly protein [Escherichia coli]|nr:tail fiber assembly protein [Escherichia coli]HAO9143587.1 tail fiber assembly protein [Escherichia coli]HBB1748097.1 tail fiber assembly protein [Escherichia coli]HCO6507186.1 tail fiber assembly protein [Escherichia coli]HCO7019459.1 tail fiber assembly protein [Escherichia coli]
MKYIYDSLTNSFYPLTMKDDYTLVGMWPEKGVEVDEDTFVEFQNPPVGKIRVAGEDGYPTWGDTPPPTKEQLVADVEVKKQTLITQANEYINSKQWPGKSALGRLKENEKQQYEAWLNYLDELENIDPKTTEDISWPKKPEK